MQTFTSSYGRKGCRVSDPTPTRSIRYHLDRMSVGTSVADIRDEVRRAITQRVAAGDEGWTPQVCRDAERFAVWYHLENRAEYAVVMGASL